LCATPAGFIGDSYDPWALGGDGRVLYLFKANDAGGVGIHRIDPSGSAPLAEAGGPTVPAQEVRGLALTRRGAFIAARRSVTARLAPTAPDGAWSDAQWTLPERAEVVGFAGCGSILHVASLEGSDLVLYSGPGVRNHATPPVVARARWPSAKASWLQIFAAPGSPLVWLWGGGLLVRIDLAIGEMRLERHVDAPDLTPLTLMSRRGAGGEMAALRSTGHFGLAPAPLSGGRWGVLNLADDLKGEARVLRVAPDLPPPLDARGASPPLGVIALYPDFILQAELSEGKLIPRRTSLPDMTAGAVATGPGGLSVLLQTGQGGVRWLDLALAPGAPPAILAECELLAPELGGQVLAALPPQGLGDSVVAPVFVGGRVALWTCDVRRDA
jgi:hypothetical protein